MFHEIYRPLLRNVDENLLQTLLKSGLPDVPGIEALILSVALGDAGYHKEPRALAKKIIKKHGSGPTQQALKLKSRKKYESQSAAKSFDADIEELAAIEGFNAPEFAKFIGLRSTAYMRGAYRYFLAKADARQLQWHFKNDFFRKGEYAFINTNYSTLDARAFAALLSSFSDVEFASRVQSLIVFVLDDFTIPPGTFQHAANLHRLDIYAPRLTDFPSALCEIESLESLEISQATLSSLPPELGQLQNLRSLELTETGLTTLPDEIGSLSELSSLELRSNVHLTSLPPSLGRCSKLSKLDLRGSPNIENIPAAILDLPALDEFTRRTIADMYGDTDPATILVREMKTFTDQFDGTLEINVPAVQEALRSFEDTGDVAQANLYELMLAVGKCYVDEEHGQSRFLHEHINKLVPEHVQKANKAISVPLYYTPETSAKVLDLARERISKSGLDGDRFLSFVKPMLGRA
ncbi:Leucine Rich repeats (2 copies) [Enhygromyxa salina]|uniref:Leucine Rich repeats (2 copies) n=1 Tax=Enhygromyxa salina TaxID=215803 RepID=A0A2S9YAG8_9BACT|nr:leucine-rich repeat domain-containing protein [Enhygromyxa salina]PRQ02104.1 Leucine Rich repeats (2 copies) [Enhygromyxa salina]